MNRAIVRMFVLAGLAITPGMAAAAHHEPPTTRKHEPLPSLDELLGLPNAAPRQDAIDRDQQALDQKLADEDPKEDMLQAVELMNQSAQRLSTSRDAGLPTQRLQEDTLRKLDKLIEQAEQNQQQSKNKQKQKKQQDQQQQQQQQNQQQKSQSQDQERANGAQQDAVSPSKQDARPNALSPAAQAAWGSLPDHVRDALVQGVSDKFSSLYQSMTEAYYRRLAEEPRENAPR